MNKKQVVYILLLAIVGSLLINVLFGRWIATKLSFVPIISRWKIIQPQTPIVIERREEVRVSDAGDLVSAVNNTKSRVSSVFVNVGNTKTVLGSAINLTSDGTFVSTADVFSRQNAIYLVQLSDGRVAPVTLVYPDSASGLVYFKAAIDNVSVASFGSSKQLDPGERIFFLTNGSKTNTPRFMASFVSSVQNDVEGKIFNADAPSRSFSAQNPEKLSLGSAAINLKSEVVGLWDGERVISSDVVRYVSGVYLSSGGKPVLPRFGFSYEVVSASSATSAPQASGTRVREVAVSGAAAQAGLQAGDIIVSVDGAAVDEDNLLEERLEHIRAGSTVTFVIERAGKRLELKLNINKI